MHPLRNQGRNKERFLLQAQFMLSEQTLFPSTKEITINPEIHFRLFFV